MAVDGVYLCLIDHHAATACPALCYCLSAAVKETSHRTIESLRGATNTLLQVSQALQRHQGGWAVLYHLSMEDAHKPLFMVHLPLVYQHFIHTENFRSAPELLALAVNVTHDRRIAEVGDQIAKHVCLESLLLI